MTGPHSQDAAAYGVAIIVIGTLLTGMVLAFIVAMKDPPESQPQELDIFLLLEERNVLI